jgi:hypothetical protein
MKDWIHRYWFYCLALIVAALHACCIITLDWPLFALLVVAGIPAWVPTLARYIKALERTGDGWRVLTREDALGVPATEIQKIAEATTTTTPPPKLPYANLSLHARRVLKSLWHFQRQTFGEDDQRRWGFAVGRQAPSYLTFYTGTKELAWEKYVVLDPHGFAYLTNEGIDFSKQNRAALDNEELYYKEFVALPTAS